ncbi:hypothetical protein [Streptomyces sp. M92]|uniref:hypothetical protein n=1 Tax=Streptomyces sp. M92 TaxID=2944250 RepID=UPI0023495790|nr:hypothetical protein [Streptomyces sp. M92]WCN06062.1 hypothetical protein M6G08_30470 [Streptomyces sp. M92]
MIRYRNHNTGDVVERRQEDARLEMLPNWERLAGDEKPGPVEADGVLSRPQASPGAAPTDPESPQAETEREFAEQQEEAGDPPAKSASKEAWVEYAQARAVSDEERAEIPSLTKDMLIAKYGEQPT